jgi:hypothetical protein
MGLSRWLQLLALAKLSREETPIKLETAAAAVQLPADEPIKLTTANTTTQTKNVSGPAFDALDVRAELLAPREGALLALDSFEVGINVFTPDPDVFEDYYKGSRVCARLDQGPWACWSVFEMQRPPLFAHVKPGPHELEAVLTDPRGDGRSILRRSWSGVRRFRVASIEELPEEDISTVTETEDQPQTVEAESMPMPRLQIDQPREMQPLPPSFEVGFGVESAAPDEFRRLFKHGHVCFELTISPSEAPEPSSGVPCWAVFENARKPLFAGLGDGFYTLRGWLLHPDSRQLVAPTQSGLRAVVTYASTTPQGLARDSSSPDANDEELKGWARHFDEESSADYYEAPGGDVQWHLPSRFPVPPSTENSTMIDLAITGEAWNEDAAVQRVVPVKPGTDAKVAATRICQGYGILNWHCVDALTAQIAEASTATAAAPAAPSKKPPPPPPPELSQIVETAPEAPAAPPQKSPVQRLKELKEAFEGGLITEAAMEKKREEILAAM